MNNSKKKQFRSQWKKKNSKEDNINLNRNDYNGQHSPNVFTTSVKNQINKKNKKHEIVYPGWNLYFIDKEYKETSSILKNIETMERFLKSNPELISKNNLRNIFNIDVNLLYSSQIFLENWMDFKSVLKNKPEYCLSCLGLAVYKVKIDELKKMNKIVNSKIKIPIIKVRILNFEPIEFLKNIKINYYGQLITVRGCIIRVNKSYHMPLLLILICNKCKLSYSIMQKNGIYKTKSKCDICGSIKFEPDLSSSYTETIPIQIVRMQDNFYEENDQGQIPRVMDIELCEDLVNTCMPGDHVTITGIIKMQSIDNGQTKFKTMSSLYIEAVSVINNNIKSKTNEALNIELSSNDYKIIKDIYINLDILTLLVHSLCPAIYGHEMIKMALLLSLFGGSSKHDNLRDNIHILIIGDPGLGKSQMLQACARVAPKGIYVSGNSSTSSGLTVTLHKESGQNDFALEPGALVLADRGCCCIDEFDKMPSQHQALLEAMEQQCVSVAKSGVLWSLPSRTSIVAAANPISGRYDKSKALNRNLNISQPLLSRFDLIFLLLDEPNKDMDQFLSEHVILMHCGNKKIKNGEYDNNNKQLNSQVNSLRNRLITKSQLSINSMPSSLLRKYISYARQYVKPVLSGASAIILQKFYLNLRKNIEMTEIIVPCNRQLEALIRLTEARAKLDLREETTEQDAIDVIELMQNTVLCLSNEKNCISFPIAKTCKNTVKTFLKLLILDANKNKISLYSVDELKNLGIKGGLLEIDISLAIDKLNNMGYLIKKSKNLYNFSAN
jgi:DNA helicase MCM8